MLQHSYLFITVLILVKIFFLLDAAILRVPVLYGEVERLEESAVTVMFDKVQFSNKSANMDHWQQRFPTNVKDVATVCRQLAEKRMLVRIERNKPFHCTTTEKCI